MADDLNPEVTQPEKGQITALLQEWQEGDAAAFEELVVLVYEDLRRLAHHQLKGAGRGKTLNTTGLVHEAYLRLVDQSRASYSDRGHFFAVAAQAMRQILINYAKKWCTQKRGGSQLRVDLDTAEVALAQQVEMVMAVDQALVKLASVEERLVRVVECSFFAGLTQTETASALGVSERTVQRDWMRAKSWLKQELAWPTSGVQQDGTNQGRSLRSR
jgi:RNA polymerase sigma factor (TIGR02999 family)